MMPNKTSVLSFWCVCLVFQAWLSSAAFGTPSEIREILIHKGKQLSGEHEDVDPALIKRVLTPFEAVDWDIAWSDLGVIASRGLSTGSSASFDAVMQCINEHHQKQNLTAQMVYNNQLGSVRVAGAWWNKEYFNSSSPVTVVTSGSMDRLMQLEAQCRTWPGPSSMVLFQGLVQEESWPLTQENQDTLKRQVLQITEFLARQSGKPGLCKPRILLTYEIYTDPAAFRLYPVNLLRNIARMQATTPLVALLDADLLPSKSLFTRFEDYSVAESSMRELEDGGKVYIIPTFELRPKYLTTTWAEALVTAPNKGLMSWGLGHDMVIQFNGKTRAAGHRLTDVKKWKTAKEDYTVEYELACEPWIMGSRTKMPWYDERYRGFGFNKMQHLLSIHTEGFQFVVLHDSYLVHRPHKHADAKRLFLIGQKSKPVMSRVSVDTKTSALKDTDLYKHVAGLYEDQVNADKEKVRWVPVLGDATSSCIRQLEFQSDAGQ